MIYIPSECAVFFRTREEYGGLSNMASGFPLVINDVQIRTSEALYQACRFPNHPDIQKNIIEQKSPMAAKMVTKPVIEFTRNDWMDVRVEIMYWCICLKYQQNKETFGLLLKETTNKQIVEKSNKDDFWGAKPQTDGTLIGENVLGNLLMILRDTMDNFIMPLLPVKNMRLYGREIS